MARNITMRNTKAEIIEAYKEMTKELNEAQEQLSRFQPTQVDEDAREAAFAQERRQHERLVRERDEAWAKQKERDEAQYTYQLELERARDEEEYQQEMSDARHELERFEEAWVQDLNEHKEAIAERERHWEFLKARVATFAEEMEQAVSQAKHQGVGIARKQARVKADKAAKDHEGRMRVLTLRSDELQTTVDKQQDQIKELTQQLAETQRQAQSLAIKAIEGASNATTYEAVREIAIEQAKQSQKNK